MTRPPCRSETGAVLAICLVFLLMLTLLAVAGSQAAINQQRMAGNHLMQQGLLVAAENALLQMEQSLLAGLLVLPEQPCTPLQCLPLTASSPVAEEQLRAAGWDPVTPDKDGANILLWYHLSLVGPPAQSQTAAPMLQGRRYRLSVIALNSVQHVHLEALYELQPR